MIASAVKNALPNWMYHPGQAAQDWAKKAAATLLQKFLDIIEGLIEFVKGLIGDFNKLVFALPAPGEPTEVDTWTTPSDGWWPGIWTAYWLFSIFAFVSFLPAWMLAHGKSQRARRQAWRRIIRAAVMVLGGWVVISLSLHVGNAASLAIAPSAAEFMHTPGNAAKLGVGFALAIAILILKAGVILVGLLVLYVQYILVHIIAGFWPLFWAMKAQPLDYLRGSGAFGMSIFYSLILLKLFQVALLRLVFELPLEFGKAVASMSTLITTAVVLAIVFIALPYVFAEKVIPGIYITHAGGKAVQRNANKLSDRMRQRMKQVPRRFHNGGTSGGGTSGNRGRSHRGHGVTGGVPPSIRNGRHDHGRTSGSASGSGRSTGNGGSTAGNDPGQPPPRSGAGSRSGSSSGSESGGADAAAADGGRTGSQHSTSSRGFMYSFNR